MQYQLFEKKSYKSRWTFSTAEGRWCGFGPYYAMFPVDFARSVVENFCTEAGSVIDPFCGRGTVPFVALASGRQSFGCDINPVAWVFSDVKINPWPEPEALKQRVVELVQAITSEDKKPQSEFQKWAWSENVLGFLNAARRELSWKHSSLDRTLLAIIMIYVHAKLGEGLSNQIRQAKAMAPNYSVRWWKERNMHPPAIDVVSFLTSKIDWRYAKGLPPKNDGRCVVELGDAREVLQKSPSNKPFDLLFTSPPYCGVTNYRYDNWIRLWLMNEGPVEPDFDNTERYANKKNYKKMIEEVFSQCALAMKEDATIYIRTDARSFTLDTTWNALRRIWPSKTAYFRLDKFKRPTQTQQFGDKSLKPGEVDILLIPNQKNISASFTPLKNDAKLSEIIKHQR